ncbi:MAG: hypothetical protein JO034_17625, partial [Singulisphaera sp.]|nr:hypothetical protein [Singulisphaera sp.]
LGLDAPHLTRFRRGKFRIYLRVQELLELIGEDTDELDEQDAIDEIEDLLGYPPEMPDLRKKGHDLTTRPGGEQQCYYARLERLEIPTIY